MDYNNINEIFAAGTENMVALFIDSGSYDGGTYTLSGADFLSFCGTKVDNIYSHGDSFWGFGTDAYHLYVNHRDTRMRSLYREEGTLYGYYKFIKIRWEGWSHYNQSAASYQLKYDLILWDTGDISLHMISVPTSSYDGEFRFIGNETLNYTKPTKDNPDVTFALDSESNTYSIKYSPLELVVPFRFLIEDADGALYTIEEQVEELSNEETGEVTETSNKVLVPLDETELSAELFLARGYDRYPIWELIKELDIPRIYCWSEIKEFPIKAEITGTPPKQYVEGTADLSDGTVLGIKALNADYTGEVTEQHSFDGAIFTDEISMEEFLTSDLDALYEGLTEEKKITFRFWLRQDATLTSFVMNYRNGDDDDAT